MPAGSLLLGIDLKSLDVDSLLGPLARSEGTIGGKEHFKTDCLNRCTRHHRAYEKLLYCSTSNFQDKSLCLQAWHVGLAVPWISLDHFATARGSKAGLGFRSLGCKKQEYTRLKVDVNQEHFCWCHWFMDNPGTSVCQCPLLARQRPPRVGVEGTRTVSDCKSTMRKRWMCALMALYDMPHACVSLFVDWSQG